MPKNATVISFLTAPVLMFILGGCTSEVPIIEEEPEAEALSFDAYVGRSSRGVATSRATIDDINSVTALAQMGGFGVFGYDQEQRMFDSYSLDNSKPNFFVNQQVWSSSQSGWTDKRGGPESHDPATDTWKYSPVKYYNNNPGARHSFFAYAPYDKNVDVVYGLGKAPQIRYLQEQNIDLLWAEPTKDLEKPSITEPVTFSFGHALARTRFHVAPFFDLVHGGESHPFPDTNIIPDGTTIRVRNIHIVGSIPYAGLLNTETGQWTPDRKGQYFDVPGANKNSWTGNGKTAVTEYNKVNGPNLLIPTRGVTVEIIYDVITGEGDDMSHITNRAESTYTFDLDQGKSYEFYLDLGLTSVKLTAKVVDWTVEKEPDVEWQVIEPITCVQIPWADVEGDGTIDIGL